MELSLCFITILKYRSTQAQVYKNGQGLIIEQCLSRCNGLTAFNSLLGCLLKMQFRDSCARPNESKSLGVTLQLCLHTAVHPHAPILKKVGDEGIIDKVILILYGSLQFVFLSASSNLILTTLQIYLTTILQKKLRPAQVKWLVKDLHRKQNSF